VKYLYIPNCKTLKKEIEEDTKRWKKFLVQRFAELILCKWSY
jgi:hypothetical protein